MSSNRTDRTALQKALARSDDCLSIDRIGEEWTAVEAQHVTGCVHCQAEFALWQSFESSATSADERAAVAQITASLERRLKTAMPGPQRRWQWLNVPRLAAAAAMIGVVSLVGYGLWDPEPKLGVRHGASGEVYRSLGVVRLLGPIGDVERAPDRLQWTPVDRSAQYEVRVMEVDRTVVWQTSSASAAADIPAAVTVQFVPGKTLLWDVVAKNAAGDAIADSGPQPFRVTAADSLRRR